MAMAPCPPCWETVRVLHRKMEKQKHVCPFLDDFYILDTVNSRDFDIVFVYSKNIMMIS